MRKRTRRVETRELQALAFSDAVRDILRADGVFKLGDDRHGDAVWEWDGVRWTRVPLTELPTDEPPTIEHEPDAEAVVG